MISLGLILKDLFIVAQEYKIQKIGWEPNILLYLNFQNHKEKYKGCEFHIWVHKYEKMKRA